ncbi:hypothetical protein [Gorillibacterium timonense]|uniref:hypothetical protein n=1 Tax=Gorillibacterium timonense TaxID=1689269 RepID=UPI00131E1B7D|nr:hypothetical protein [Gorillibacterium timonense]
MEELEDKILPYLRVLVLTLFVSHIVFIWNMVTHYQQKQYSGLRKSIRLYFSRDLTGGLDTTGIYHWYYDVFKRYFLIDNAILFLTLALLVYLFMRNKGIFLGLMLAVYSGLFIVHIFPDLWFMMTGNVTILTGVRFLFASGASHPGMTDRFQDVVWLDRGCSRHWICHLHDFTFSQTSY